MNSIERFYATVERREVDRPAVWMGLPHPEAVPGLLKQFHVGNLHELKLAALDDFYAVDMPYKSPVADAIFAAFDWYGKGRLDDENRTLTAPGCFHDAETLEDLKFDWPDPKKYIDVDECKRRVDMAPADKAVLGILWSAHFQDACASFGMETALMNMISDPELYEYVDKKIVDFYLEANDIFYRATKGKLHAVLIGNDMGSQRGLLLSPEMVREFIMPGCKKLVDQAHSYGVKVIYHSCGSIDKVIPDLIEAGVDVIHPIQALAKGMQPELLKPQFGDKVSFCGGVDTQDLLVNGSPEDVRRKVRELRKIFPTGLIISPSHEAIQPDVPPSNIQALFEEAETL